MFSESLLTQEVISQEYHRQAQQERLINSAARSRPQGLFRLGRLVGRLLA